MNIQEIMDKAKEIEGRRRTRTIEGDDAEKAIELMDSGLYKSITVYAEGGNFVPNSYKYRAPMSVIHCHLTDDGWTIIVNQGDAKRRMGRGPWATAVLKEHGDGAHRTVA